jgi:integrase
MLTLPVVPQPADRHPAKVYIARLAPGSRRTMRAALDVIAGIVSAGRHDAETLPWADVRYQHTTAVRTALMERYAPATANKMLAALLGALREAWRLGQMNAEDYRRAADLEAVRGQTLHRGRALAVGELRGLFEACARDSSPAGRRDAALLALLYGSGLRRSEAVNLDASDYAPETGELRVRRGKGRKDRLVYVPNGAAEALGVWLSLRGTEPGPLFHAVDKGGAIRRGHWVYCQ